jgi:hypothetical protein
VVVLNKTREPLDLPASRPLRQQRKGSENDDPVATCGNDPKQSETAYIHAVAFNTNLMPPAKRDLRSPDMDSGDYAC